MKLNHEGRSEERIELLDHKRNLEVMLYGEKHPNVLRTCLALSSEYLEMNEYEVAEKYAERAESGLIAAYGRGHQDVAEALLAKAMVAKATGDFGRSIELSGHALEILSENPDADSRAVVSAMRSLGRDLVRAGRLEEASRVFADAADAYRVPSDALDVDMKNVDELLARASDHMEMRDFSRAESVYAEAVATSNRRTPVKNLVYLPENLWDLVVRRAHAGRGHANREMGKFQAALISYSNALSIDRKGVTAGDDQESIIDGMLFCHIALGDLVSADRLASKYPGVAQEPRMRFSRAQRLFEIGKRDEGLHEARQTWRALEESLANDPDRVLAETVRVWIEENQP